MESKDFNINDLLGRQLWQLSCQEYLTLMRYLLTQGVVNGHHTSDSTPCQAIGMVALAKALGCSVSLLYGIRHKIDFAPAIISHIGRKPIFNVEVARTLANEYMEHEREERRRGEGYGEG